jgi:hypothetical protein
MEVGERVGKSENGTPCWEWSGGWVGVHSGGMRNNWPRPIEFVLQMVVLGKYPFIPVLKKSRMEPLVPG